MQVINISCPDFLSHINFSNFMFEKLKVLVENQNEIF